MKTKLQQGSKFSCVTAGMDSIAKSLAINKEEQEAAGKTQMTNPFAKLQKMEAEGKEERVAQRLARKKLKI